MGGKGHEGRVDRLQCGRVDLLHPRPRPEPPVQVLDPPVQLQDPPECLGLDLPRPRRHVLEPPYHALRLLLRHGRLHRGREPVAEEYELSGRGRGIGPSGPSPLSMLREAQVAIMSRRRRRPITILAGATSYSDLYDRL